MSSGICRCHVETVDNDAREICQKRSHYGIPVYLKYEFSSGKKQGLGVVVEGKMERILQRISVALV